MLALRARRGRRARRHDDHRVAASTSRTPTRSSSATPTATASPSCTSCAAASAASSAARTACSCCRRDRAGAAPRPRERLHAIEEYSELGAGFRIAMRDLEIRGAGNLLGAAAVGPHRRRRLRPLLPAARRGRRAACRGERPAPARARLPRRSTCPAAIPDDYVRDVREKFRLFRRIATARGARGPRRAARRARRPLRPPARTRSSASSSPSGCACGRAAGASCASSGAERPGVILKAPGSAERLERLRRSGLPDPASSAPESVFLPTPASGGRRGRAAGRPADAPAPFVRLRGGPFGPAACLGSVPGAGIQIPDGQPPARWPGPSPWILSPDASRPPSSSALASSSPSPRAAAGLGNQSNGATGPTAAGLQLRSRRTARRRACPPGYRPQARRASLPPSRRRELQGEELDVKLAVVEGEVITRRRLVREAGGPACPVRPRSPTRRRSTVRLKERARLLIFVPRGAPHRRRDLSQQQLEEITPEQLEREVNEARETIGRQVTADVYLAEQGLTLDEYREHVARAAPVPGLPAPPERAGSVDPRGRRWTWTSRPPRCGAIYWSNPGAFDEQVGVKAASFPFPVEEVSSPDDVGFLDAEEDGPADAEKPWPGLLRRVWTPSNSPRAAGCEDGEASPEGQFADEGPARHDPQGLKARLALRHRPTHGDADRAARNSTARRVWRSLERPRGGVSPYERPTRAIVMARSASSGRNGWTSG